MLRWIVVLLIMVAMAGSTAVAQDAPDDPLAYTPTGDALWDTYAQALLELLEDGVSLADVTGYTPPALSLETLDTWESEFGDDPRYWQLRYWDASVQPTRDNEPWIDPVVYLERAVANGVNDPVTAMLLYGRHQDMLVNNWELYCEGTLPADSDFAPDTSDGATAMSWFIEQDLTLADQLVAACPAESWAWYEHAMKRFEYGDWEAGLDDLRTGNQAANNRYPLPFPISFINERIAGGQHCGNEIAAGMALQGESVWPLPNFIRKKSQFKNQEVRLLLGAPLNEYEPWHYYTCRLGSMDGADSLQWLVAHILRNMMLKHLLVTTPEAFTIDQRDALWGLYGRCYKIKDLVRKASDGRTVELMHSWDLVNAKYGIDASSEAEGSAFWLTDTGKAMERELLVTLYRLSFTEYKAEHGEIFAAVKERFDLLATFDFTTYSWPEEE